MDFDLSEEQRLLKESVDGLLTDSYEFDQRKKYMAEKGGWSKAIWSKLAEQGLLGLPFAEAGFQACEQAVMTHGGFGYAREYHVERYLRESLIPRIAPISPQLILSFIAEKVLGLPKSY